MCYSAKSAKAAAFATKHEPSLAAIALATAAPRSPLFFPKA